MGAIGDILQVQNLYTVLGQSCRNVFYYEIGASSTGSLLATTIAEALADYFEPKYLAFLADDNTHDRVLVDNLTDGLDFGEAVTGNTGSQVGDGLPSFVAVNVTLPRTSKLTRNGSKRISGFVETQLTQQSWDFATAQQTAILQICTNSISITDYDGSGGVLDLDGVIVGRTQNMAGVYELDLAKINNYGSPIINTIATTQRTRKA